MLSASPPTRAARVAGWIRLAAALAALVVIWWIAYGVVLERLPPGPHVLERWRLDISPPPHRDIVLALAIFMFVAVRWRRPRPPQGGQEEGEDAHRRRRARAGAALHALGRFGVAATAALLACRLAAIGQPPAGHDSALSDLTLLACAAVLLSMAGARMVAGKRALGFLRGGRTIRIACGIAAGAFLAGYAHAILDLAIVVAFWLPDVVSGWLGGLPWWVALVVSLLATAISLRLCTLAVTTVVALSRRFLGPWNAAERFVSAIEWESGYKVKAGDVELSGSGGSAGISLGELSLDLEVEPGFAYWIRQGIVAYQTRQSKMASFAGHVNRPGAGSPSEEDLWAQVRTVVESIRNESGLPELRLRYQAIGDHEEASLWSPASDGWEHLEAGGRVAPTMEALREIRRRDYSAGEGTWFTTWYTSSARSWGHERDRHSEPAWDRPPEPRHYPLEACRFPAVRPHTPLWLRAELRRARWPVASKLLDTLRRRARWATSTASSSDI